MDSYQNLVVETVKLNIQQAEAYYQQAFLVPNVTFKLRGKSAGQFYFYNGRVELQFNLKLLHQHPSTFIEEVVPHEVAHLVVHCLWGMKVRPHGLEWRSVMEQCFHLPAKTYHDMPVSPSRQHAKPYAYQCLCDTHYFTERRHKNRKKGYVYTCLKCKSDLRFVGDVATTQSEKQRALETNKHSDLFELEA